jgi:hypothetical protein
MAQRVPRAGEEFKSGEKCRRSGVYRVIHDSGHTSLQHQVTVIFGTDFPQCRGCGDQPRFMLVHGAQYVKQNRYFKDEEEP